MKKNVCGEFKTGAQFFFVTTGEFEKQQLFQISFWLRRTKKPATFFWLCGPKSCAPKIACCAVVVLRATRPSAAIIIAEIGHFDQNVAPAQQRSSQLYPPWHVHIFAYDHLVPRTAASNINPFRTAVPFWGQTSQIPSSLSPKRDCGAIRVNRGRTQESCGRKDFEETNHYLL